MTYSEHDPVQSARPELGRSDAPDAIRPGATDEPHRKLPPEDDAPDTPDAPTGPGAQA